MDHELRTIKDIFDKVPEDRIEDCLKELGIALRQALRMKSVIATISGQAAADQFVWPDALTWRDDGKRTIEITVTDELKSAGISLTTVLG